jgi:hypothetical protein
LWLQHKLTELKIADEVILPRRMPDPYVAKETAWIPYVIDKVSRFSSIQFNSIQWPSLNESPRTPLTFRFDVATRQIGVDERTVVVGHSSGAVAAMRLLGGGIPANENGVKLLGVGANLNPPPFYIYLFVQHGSSIFVSVLHLFCFVLFFLLLH